MHFLVSKKRRVVFGWSAKCGCSHVKKMWNYLNSIDCDDIHKLSYGVLPMDIHNYTTILFTRNPYKRIVSGFLDKYRTEGEFRPKWKSKTITFSHFVDAVIKESEQVHKHHFTPQASENYSDKVFSSKITKIYNIDNIDYQYIGSLFEKELTKHIIEWKGPHIRSLTVKKEHNGEYVYDVDMNEYFDRDVETKCFYNSVIKQKVFNYYKEDFDVFFKNGIDVDT